MTRTALLSYNQISWYKICCMTVSGSETGRISPEILRKQEAKVMKQLDMRGKACPMPVIETKKIFCLLYFSPVRRQSGWAECAGREDPG